MKKSKAALVATAMLGAPAATVTPALAAPAPKAEAVATFDVAGERFKVRFTSAADVAYARKVLAGKE